jgi:hypothetical protein
MLLVGLAVAVVAGAIAGVAGSLRGSPAVTGTGENRPGDVLLVPGYGGSTTALDGLAAKISAVGRTAIVVHLAGKGTGDLRVQADVLNGYVSSALASTGSAHSSTTTAVTAAHLRMRSFFIQILAEDTRAAAYRTNRRRHRDGPGRTAGRDSEFYPPSTSRSGT